ncbi:unnamed protein product [Blepharisma stoltei]|uniref:DOMON domain-containing protein n=1 Tax=Blepharisma stoltei TaxID=1481888 RepID=A0AAU9K228_9CILI|nr:unnamed protein product [Blepharisma stoltei]
MVLFKAIISLFILSFSLTSAYTAIEITSNIYLGWYFPSTTTIQFYLSVSTSKLSESSYGYVGLGFKSSGSATDMVGADCALVALSQKTIESVQCVADAYPASDTFSLSGFTSYTNGTFTVYQWSRALSNGGTSNHMTLVSGTEYKLIYSHGQYTTQPIQHTSEGGTTLKLTYDTVAPPAANSGGDGNPTDSSSAIIGIGIVTLLMVN